MNQDFCKIKLDFLKSTLVFERKRHSQVICLGMWFPIGSRFEQNNEQGLFHFLEHIVFKNKKIASLLKFLEEKGADINAFTAHEYTCYQVTCLKEDLDLGLNFLSHIKNQFKISKKQLENEKSVIIQEIRSAKDDIENDFHELIMKYIFEGSGLSHSIAGSEESVKNITLNHLKKAHFQYYEQNFCVISIVGDFEKKNLLQKINKYFAHPLKSNLKKNILKNDKKNSSMFKSYISHKSFFYYQNMLFYDDQKKFHSGVYCVERNTQQVYFAIIFPCHHIFDHERWVAHFFNSWFAQGMSSHLFKKVREDLGLVYFIQGNASFFLDRGFYLIEASSELMKMPEVIEVVFKEIKLLKKRKFDQIWLKKIKALLRGQILISHHDFESRMHSIGINELIFQTYDTTQSIIKKYYKISLKKVKNYIKNRLDLEKAAIVLYGPKAKEFEPFIREKIKQNS